MELQLLGGELLEGQLVDERWDDPRVEVADAVAHGAWDDLVVVAHGAWGGLVVRGAWDGLLDGL